MEKMTLFIAPPSLHYLASPGITIVCSTTPSLAKLTPLHIPSEAKCLCTDKSERYRPDDTLSIRNDIITIVTNIIFRIEDGACKQTKPCPMCTGLIDGFNGNAVHLAQNVDLAIVAAADLAALRAHARTRGWDKLRLLSAGSSTFKYDIGSEDREGNQDSEISVFTRDADGTLRHFYSAHPKLAPDVNERGLDLVWSLWNLLDLTPQGRPNWYAKLDYPERSQASRA